MINVVFAVGLIWEVKTLYNKSVREFNIIINISIDVLGDFGLGFMLCFFPDGALITR